MMKLIWPLLFTLLSFPIWATQTCISTDQMNQSSSLYSRGDLIASNGSNSAQERMCTQQRRTFFSQCMREQFESALQSRLRICTNSSEGSQSIADEFRSQCGARTFGRSFPDCPSEEYAFPTCRQFSGVLDANTRNRCVLGEIAPGIGSLEPLADEMTREQRSQQVLNSLRDNLISNFEAGLEPLTAYRTCLQSSGAENSPQQVSIQGQQVSCERIIDFLMAKVITTLPRLRQHQILSQGPHFRARSDDGRTFRRTYRRQFPNTELSDEEINSIGQNVSLRRQELPIGESPEPTENEIQDAAFIRDQQFAHRDQQFLEANHDKEPFRNCVIPEGEGEERQFRFISISDDRTQAMLCGIDSARTEGRIVNTIFQNADELNMSDADQFQAHDAFLSYRAKVTQQHDDAIDEIIAENPFLAHLNLSTDDLPLESDSAEIQNQKRRNVMNSLLRSFAMMETQARGELNNVRNENNMGELRSLMMRNPALIEESIRNQPNLDKRTCDTLQSLHMSQRVSDRTSGALRITASILGGLSCPFTWGAGCLLAAAAQIPHVKELNRRRNMALGEFFTGQGNLDDYLAAEREHYSSKALLGLELVGIPVLGTGRLALRSLREASRVSRFSPTALRGSRPVMESVPRISFGRDIDRALSVSRSQGNVELFTVHGMASSHTAVRIGDTVYHTGQGFGKSIGSSVPGANGDFVAEPFESFLRREMRTSRAVEGLTLRVPESELAVLRGNAERFAEQGQRYSLMNSNCAQTVCDIVTQNGARTVDVERTFDPLVLRQRFNNSIGDRAVSQNIYGREGALGSSSRRRFLMANTAYAIGLTYGETFFDVLPDMSN